MQTITPFLWFNDNLGEALDFYCSIFSDAKVLSSQNMGGKLFTATFELQGQRFMGLNGGPMFQFTEATSFFISCKTQEEVDMLWERLSEGGQKSRCGWLKDQFGLSWQVIPEALGNLLYGGGDQARSKRVMDAMLKMDKIIIADLQAAYDGAGA